MFTIINNVTISLLYINPPKYIIISLEKIPGGETTGSESGYLNVLYMYFKASFLNYNPVCLLNQESLRADIFHGLTSF